MQQTRLAAQTKSATYNVSLMSDTPAISSPVPPAAHPVLLAPTRSWLPLVALLALASLVGNFLLWSKLARIQDNLASASAQAQILAQEAKLLASSSTERSDSTQAKLALVDAKLDAFNAQNTQVETLLQNAARTQNDYLLADIESSLRLAQQQAQFTGNAQTLIDALQQAEQRLGQSGEGAVFLQPVLAALSRDLERLQTGSYPDIAAAVERLDRLADSIDRLPMLAQQPRKDSDVNSSAAASATPPAKWQRWLMPAWVQVRSLLQISRVESADAALISPSELYFVRENIKLQLLSARTALLSRRLVAAQSALAQVSKQLKTYSDTNTPAYKKAQELLTQAQSLSGPSGQDSVPTASESARAIAAASARYQASQAAAPRNKTQGQRKP